MKVVFVIDSLPKAGGGNTATIAECSSIKKMLDKSIEIIFLTTSKDTKNYLDKNFSNSILFFNKNSLINQIYLFLMNSVFFKFLIKKIKLKNSLEKLLSKNNIDLLIFLSPSELIFFANNQNFIYTVWEFQHKNYPFFPEYKNSYFDIDKRDQTLKIASDKAFKIIVGTEKSKKDFIKYYLCDENKIIVRPLKSSMVNINLKENFNSDLIARLKEKKINQYLFYPAQYWAHKNHKFIIDAFEKFSLENRSNIHCIFAGADKGNLSYIKDLINSKKLGDKIHINEYLTDEEIVYLYKNCYAIVVPTLVGSLSYPVIEGFFFKKPVICGVKNLDEEYKRFILPLDFEKPETLEKSIDYIKSNPDGVRLNLLNAKSFFDKHYDDEKLSNQYIKMISEFNYYNQMWKY